jgi:exonuclease I
MWAKLLSLLSSVEFLNKVWDQIQKWWVLYKASKLEKTVQTGRELASLIEKAKTDEERTKLLKALSDYDAKQ